MRRAIVLPIIVAGLATACSEPTASAGFTTWATQTAPKSANDMKLISAACDFFVDPDMAYQQKLDMAEKVARAAVAGGAPADSASNDAIWWLTKNCRPLSPEEFKRRMEAGRPSS